MTLKKLTIDEIRSWEPCYDPARYLPADWSGTALDILALTAVPPEDRLWVVLRPEVLNDTTLRRLACAFVRETPICDGRTVWDLLTDPRSRAAVETAEKYCDGLATAEELDAARAAAEAAWAAARSASAARAAAWAARAAARSASAARAAVWAAEAAARAAAWAAATTENSAVWAAEAALAAQCKIATRVITQFCDAD
jgi:hypothetical protein